MSDIILWSLLAFFGAFGLIEFIRFVYTDWHSSEDDFHVVVCANKVGDNIEGALRNAAMSTDAASIIVISDTMEDDEITVLKKLQRKYPCMGVMKTEEYIDYLKK